LHQYARCGALLINEDDLHSRFLLFYSKLLHIDSQFSFDESASKQKLEDNDELVDLLSEIENEDEKDSFLMYLYIMD
jgi:hypothetical protein